MKDSPDSAIAVVGLSLGFPQDVTTSDALWELMWEKRNTATKIPPERLNIDSIYHPDRHRRGQVYRLGFRRIDTFWLIIFNRSLSAKVIS